MALGSVETHSHYLIFQGPSSSGVEQRIENPRVGGSNPPSGTIFSNKNSFGSMVHTLQL